MADKLHYTSSELPAFLGQTVLFGGLPESQLLELANIAIARTYNKEESLFQQGDAGTGFFIVRSGRIKVFKLAKDGREQILHVFGETNHFAEVPALDGKPYPASATAIEATTVLFFSSPTLLATARTATRAGHQPTQKFCATPAPFLQPGRQFNVA